MVAYQKCIPGQITLIARTPWLIWATRSQNTLILTILEATEHLIKPILICQSNLSMSRECKKIEFNRWKKDEGLVLILLSSWILNRINCDATQIRNLKYFCKIDSTMIGPRTMAGKSNHLRQRIKEMICSSCLIAGLQIDQLVRSPVFRTAHFSSRAKVIKTIASTTSKTVTAFWRTQ